MSSFYPYIRSGFINFFNSFTCRVFGKSLQVAPVVEFVSLYTGGEDDNKVLVFAHHHNMMNG